MELESISQPALEQIDRLRGADLVVGVLDADGNGGPAASAALVREVLPKFSDAARAVLIVDDGTPGPRLEDQQPLSVLYCKLSEPNVTTEASPQTIFEAYQTIFGLSGRIGARACGVIASDLRTVTPEWIDRLVRPALEMEFDLVAPLYARHKWEGLLNRSVLSPLSRALYGKRIENPMGPDFGLSGKLMRRILDDYADLRRGAPRQPLASLASIAIQGNFQICQAHVGTRAHPPTEGTDLSSLLAQVLGPVFVDMDRNAAVWQRVRGSQPLPDFGEPEPAPAETGAVDVRRMIDSFKLGAANLQDVWSQVLPPTTLFEIRKLSRLAPDQFRMPDSLWVWIVYDFALGHRFRTINRDHLLRSFTPLYLGWIASYALEMENADSAAVESRLERLARAYETGKPYLVSRWRWPDRFNP